MIASPHTYKRVVDANEAVADVAYRLSEIVSIFPITPSSPMAEQCDEWSASGRVNLWHQVPEVVQMQSEAGVAGTYHGTLSAGSLSTTFTASQGLLLMIPNMYKIAGELLPTVMHVSARALATNALSIFGDHSDVMACRQTGWAMLASNNVQEAHDMAAIAHAATLLTRLPFLHFFDGFRTSHEVNVLQPVADEVLRQLIDPSALAGFYERGLTPDKPSIRGSAHNPDTYFQSREAVNPFYRDAAETVQGVMDNFARLTGRSYRNFEYRGAEDAETVLIMMGSGAETAMETTAWLNRNEGAKTGVLSVRLYRPWNTKDLLAALPSTVRRLVVLDRTKEPGSVGEPLYLDVALSLRKAGVCVPEKAGLATAELCGGRYGIGSKEFTPAMVRSVLDAAATNELKDHFTVGILDDVTYRSIQFNAAFNIESASTRRAVFWGLGSDGTVGANKNTIKIIGEYTDFYTQAYFVYDSKKSGGLTTSHLRFGPDPIRAPYLIEQAQFVACHQFQFMGRMPVLDMAAQGGTFLLNSPYAADQVLRRLPTDVVATMRAKELKVYVIDADGLARNLGLGNRINVIMQTCFFALTDLLPIEQAQDAIKDAIAKTYGKKGGKIVALNNSAVDAAGRNWSNLLR